MFWFDNKSRRIKREAIKSLEWRRVNYKEIIINFTFVPSLDYSKVYQGPVYTIIKLDNGKEIEYNHPVGKVGLSVEDMTKRLRTNAE